MPDDPSPRCPGCGYPIFGLRDMRCPECGRALDVRDFSLDDRDAATRQRKLKRDGRIGAAVGSFALLIPLVAVGLLAFVFLRVGMFPPVLIVFMLVALVIWLGRIIVWAGREELTGRKKKR